MRYLRSLMISLLIGFFIGLSIPGFADDTDLYLGRGIVEITDTMRPNLLFVLDNSGSMSGPLRDAEGNPTGKTRIQALKEALYGMLDPAESVGIHDVNIGLARFAQDGGVNKANAPILYPITYIDEKLKQVEKGEVLIDIQPVQPLDSADDAEEDVTSKVVVTDNKVLQMTKVETIPGGTKVETRVGDNATSESPRNAMETVSSGKIDVYSRIMYLGKSPTDGKVITALQFSKLDIPPNAVINKAEVIFKNESKDYTGSLNLIIRGAGRGGKPGNNQDARTVAAGYDKSYASFRPNAGQEVPFWFSTEANFPRKLGTTTFPTVKWAITSTTKSGQEFYTPDLAPIVQDIVNDTTYWNAGNNIVLLFENDPTATIEGSRAFLPQIYDPSLAPKLRVFWTFPTDKPLSFLPPSDITNTGNFLLRERKSDKAVMAYSIALGVNKDSKAEQIVGVRFVLPSYLQKAKGIVKASISLEPDTVSSATTADSLALRVWGEKTTNAAEFPKGTGTVGNGTLSSRLANKTAASVPWDNVPVVQTPKKYSIEVTPIIKEILSGIGTDGWKSTGNGMVLLFEKASGTGSRSIIGKPTLELWLENDPEATKPKKSKQLVGIRFPNVEVPQGALIKEAWVDFTNGDPTSGTTNLTIQAEESGNAAPFKGTDGDISTRKLFSDKVEWKDVPAWTDPGAIYPAEKPKDKDPPDLTALVQKVVSLPTWCGGTSALGLVISSPDEDSLRIAKSFDDDTGPYAPRLHIKYDLNTINGTGCMNETYTNTISSVYDDAVQVNSDGTVNPTGMRLYMGQNEAGELTVGLRFQRIPVSRTAEVIEAKLVFTATHTTIGDETSKTTLTISGQKSADAPEFNNATFDLSNRPKTSAKVTWEPESWKNGRQYQTIDIKDIVKEILGQESWMDGNSLALFVSGNGLRTAAAFNSQSFDKQPPTLKIKVRGSLGDALDLTVRSRLKTMVRDLTSDYTDSAQYTPFVDALYESAQYYLGKSVVYGKDRYSKRSFFVSNPNSYTSGTLVGPSEPYQCPNMKRVIPSCQDESIEGDATYISPLTGTVSSTSKKSCGGTNHIVLFTDGIPTRINSVDQVKQLIGKGSCQKTFPDGDSIDTYQMCGIDLSEYLHTKGNGKGETIAVHTIGFQLGKGWYTLYEDQTGKKAAQMNGLKGWGNYYDYQTADENSPPSNLADPAMTFKQVGYVENPMETATNAKAAKYLREVARVGGGNFYLANTAQDLKEAFTSIAAEAMNKSSSFAAPSVSVNTANRLYHRNEVYFALFKPGPSERWDGNVKKFLVCEGKSSDSCKVGDILDSSSPPKSAIDPEKKYIKSDAKSYWSGDADGGDVVKGGAGANIPSPDKRTIFTYISEDTDNPSTEPGTNHAIDLNVEENQVIPDNAAITDKLLGTVSASKSKSSDSALKQWKREEVIRWIRGEDVADENGNGNTTDARWMLSDPLHSSPVAVSYTTGSGSKTATSTKLFFGTNDGLIHMVNAESGAEEWAFLPQEMFSIQQDLMRNEETGKRIYGIDGTPAFWIKDENGDNVINGNDFVRMYIGMRRGGRNVYALDVTKPDSPKLMWVIKGGIEGDNFQRLGQTWSQPKPAMVVKGGKARVVLFFGGGYDPSQDNNKYGPPNGEPTMGNAVYMVDAETGERLWWASSYDDANLKLGNMIHAIPSDLTLLDTDGDKATDRIYVGDMGGQMWRIDLDGLGGSGKGANGVGGRLAQIAPNSLEGVDVKDRRRFFYPPEVVKMSDTVYSSQSNYYMVTTVTGTRPDPLSNEGYVHDRFYALRDTALTSLVNLATTGPDLDTRSETAAKKTSFYTLTMHQEDNPSEFDLFDATSNVIQQGDEAAQVKATEELINSKGWYVNLNGKYDSKTGKMIDDSAWVGEKGLASPVVLGGKVFFTTYTPDPPEVLKDQCKAAEGTSRLYVLDLLNGSAAYDMNEKTNSEGSSLKRDDRSRTLKAGITADLVPMFLSGGDIRLLSTSLETLMEGGDGKGNAIERIQLAPTFWKQQ